jgi:hydroxymethylglutaryl-CoA lyase
MRNLATLGNFLPQNLPSFFRKDNIQALRFVPIEFSMLPRRVDIVDVSARDGLQNERSSWSAPEKINLIRRLSQTGLRDIEVGSFVSPKAVPQMVGSLDVFAGVKQFNTNCRYHMLVPNAKMMEKAIVADVKTVSVFVSAAEDFSRRNTNRSVDESLKETAEVCKLARANGIRVRGYVSCVFHSTDKSEVITPKRVVNISENLLSLGCYEVSLGDTLGSGTPLLTADLLIAFPFEMRRFLAGHFHDTQGNAARNFIAAMHFGVTTFDATVGGIGGCPYAPGAKGNVDMRQLLYLCQVLGIETGVSYNKICKISEDVLQTISIKSRDAAVSRAYI